MKVGSFVTVQEDGSFISPEFKRWIKEHEGRKFYVEQTFENSSKLSKVHFWISNNYLRKSN